MTWYQLLAVLFAVWTTIATGLDNLRWLIKRDVSVSASHQIIWSLAIVLCIASFTGVSW